MRPTRRGTANDNRPMFDLRGAVLTQDLLNQMNRIGQHYGVVGMVGGSQMAKQDMVEDQHQAIP